MTAGLGTLGSTLNATLCFFLNTCIFPVSLHTFKSPFRRTVPLHGVSERMHPVDGTAEPPVRTVLLFVNENFNSSSKLLSCAKTFDV